MTEPREFQVFKIRGAVDPLPRDVVIASLCEGDPLDGLCLLMEPSEALRFLVLARQHSSTRFDLRRETDVLSQIATLSVRAPATLVFVRAPELEILDESVGPYYADRCREHLDEARNALDQTADVDYDTLDGLEEDALGISSYAEQLKLEGMDDVSPG